MTVSFGKAFADNASVIRDSHTPTRSRIPILVVILLFVIKLRASKTRNSAYEHGRVN